MNISYNLMLSLGFTIVSTSIFLIFQYNDIFAIEYSNTNDKYDIELKYPNIIYLAWTNTSYENKDNSMIIPIGGDFKENNDRKISACYKSYHSMIPKIYRDDEKYKEGSVVACVYGLYNYNVNIGSKQTDRFLISKIELETTQCMFDDHCMDKINDILKGKIALYPIN